MGNLHSTKIPPRLDAVLAEADKCIDNHMDDHVEYLRNKMTEIEDETKRAIQIYRDERNASIIVDQIFWNRIYPKMKTDRHHIRLSKNEYTMWDYVLTEFTRRGYLVEINNEKNNNRNYDCTIRWRD